MRAFSWIVLLAAALAALFLATRWLGRRDAEPAPDGAGVKVVTSPQTPPARPPAPPVATAEKLPTIAPPATDESAQVLEDAAAVGMTTNDPEPVEPGPPAPAAETQPDPPS